MHLYRFTSLLLTTTTLAVQQPYQIPNIPKNGVTCETSAEPAHSFSNTILQSTAEKAREILPVNSSTYFPAPLPASFLGYDENGDNYTIKWGPDCDPTKNMTYLPAGYDDMFEPNWSATLAPAGEVDHLVTPVILVMQFEKPTNTPDGGADPYKVENFWDARYCAVLTNSDAEADEWLYYPTREKGKTETTYILNTSPGGYHQCNENP